MSTGLASLQAGFQAYVLEGRETVAAMVDAESEQAALERLRVYARAYELRLIEVLRTDFPALRKMAGDDVFDGLARDYLHAHPSDNRSARWFGRHFPDFVATRASSLPHPAMAEMARFEWTLGLAFDAPDAPVLAFEELGAILPAQLASASFRLHPSVQRIDLRWNVPALFTALDEDLDPQSLQAAAVPASWVVWRPNLTSRFRALEADEKLALDTFAAGETLADVCERLKGCMAPDEVPARAAQLIRRWLDERMLAGAAPA